MFAFSREYHNIYILGLKSYILQVQISFFDELAKFASQWKLKQHSIRAYLWPFPQIWFGLERPTE